VKPFSVVALALLVGLVLGVVATPVVRGLLDREPSLPVPLGTLEPVPEGSEWLDLLDAKHRDAWRNINDEDRIFEITPDNELHLFGTRLRGLRYVGYTGRDFENFELYFQARLAPRTNSGVFVRAQGTDKVYRGFEIQVIDDHGDPPNKHGTGAIYDVVTPMFNMAFPAGEWNSYRIRLDGDDVRIWINGWLVIHTDLSKMDTPLGKFEVAYRDIPNSGMITFQDHGGAVWYRNIRLRVLGNETPDT
jgi:hypothetical protein